MDRPLNQTIWFLVLPTVGVSASVVLLVSIWSMAYDASPGTVFLRGLLTIIVTVLLALIPCAFLIKLLKKPLTLANESLAAALSGDTIHPYGFEGPTELSELAQKVASLLDQQERRLSALTREWEQDAQSARNAALRCLAKGIVREIQKPMTGVMGFADIAARTENLQGQLKNYLTLIERESRATREAVERIVRFANDEKPSTELVDINKMVVKSTQDLISSLEQKKIRLQLNLSQQVKKVQAAPNQLMEVFTTLVKNAQEAMTDGGTLEVSTNLQEDKDVVIVFKDTGPGIPEKMKHLVFTPFFTNKELPGAGLSLAIAHNIVRNHKGTLDYFSSPEGTVFFVSLPIDG